MYLNEILDRIPQRYDLLINLQIHIMLSCKNFNLQTNLQINLQTHIMLCLHEF